MLCYAHKSMTRTKSEATSSRSQQPQSMACRHQAGFKISAFITNLEPNILPTDRRSNALSNTWSIIQSFLYSKRRTSLRWEWQPP